MKYPRLLKPTEASKAANVATTQPVVSVIKAVLLLYNNLLTQRQTRNYTSNSESQKVKNGYECGSNSGGGSSSGIYKTDFDRCGKSHMSTACCAYGRTCRGYGETRHYRSCCLSGSAGARTCDGAAAVAGGSTQ